MAAVFEVRGLGKRYRRGAPFALQDVDLNVQKGEIFGLLGRNGAGKTTLVKCLLGLVRPTRGEAFLFGEPAGRTEQRRRVGYLPEDHRFPEYQSAEGAMRFHGRLSRLDAATIARRTDELLELVDLQGARRHRVRTFSKGMKQRLGLAQAMIHEPELLFLDEPTDGVDPLGRRKIREVLQLLSQQGISIVVNSHLLGEVEQLCGRVGILEKGRLARLGSMEEFTRLDSGGFAITCDRICSRELWDRLQEHFPNLGYTELTLNLPGCEDFQIDWVIDQLRAEGVGLRRLESMSVSLETAFIQILEEAEGQA